MASLRSRRLLAGVNRAEALDIDAEKAESLMSEFGPKAFQRGLDGLERHLRSAEGGAFVYTFGHSTTNQGGHFRPSDPANAAPIDENHHRVHRWSSGPGAMQGEFLGAESRRGRVRDRALGLSCCARWTPCREEATTGRCAGID